MYSHYSTKNCHVKIENTGAYYYMLKTKKHHALTMPSKVVSFKRIYINLPAKR